MYKRGKTTLESNFENLRLFLVHCGREDVLRVIQNCKENENADIDEANILASTYL